MQNSYQSSHPNQDAAVIVLARRPQELLDALFMRAGESSSPISRAGKGGNPQPVGSSTSPTTIRSDNSSPALLPPPLQLSASTLSGSDFPSASHSSDASLPHDHGSCIEIPSLHTGPVPGTWAAAGEAEGAAARQRHWNETMPRVLEASKRLQQIMGLRNEDEFKPPTPLVRPGRGMVAVGNVVDFNPALRHLRGSTANLGLQIREASQGPVRMSCEMVEAAMESEKLRRGGNGNVQGQQPQQRKLPKPGLREALLWHGMQPYGNQARTELRSVSFHDLTPDMRTGGFRNELLAHFETDVDFRTRLVCYEVDV
jgi:hypothetical protein